ncbi:PIN domain-containing protein [Cognataquiflexum rubidum]|uniref:type II toxin-antitoxin system VapC family toxin n=1 Tax=Cognataquiflexum rubidum TaxID=2922273 RepID=UPI001F1450A6|nr:PIN domain-containing protein [Cognataquiflexum rubidum]MCH6234593.1 PIN domain-containing protein [Cognataquiflexum rubidum]
MEILVDTSKWISFLNNPDDKDSELFQSQLVEDKICICPPIFQELLQGCRNKKEFDLLEDKLSGLLQLVSDPYLAAVGAGKLYLEMRQKGATIRKSNDCLIAWFAIEYNLPVWHLDRDFDTISKHSNLKIFG